MTAYPSLRALGPAIGMDRLGDRSMFASDCILPAQQRRRYARADEGLHKLAWAVFNDAVKCAALPQGERGGTRGRLRTEAREWFAADDEGPFTLRGICDTLGFEAGYIRGLLAAGRLHWARDPRRVR